MPLVAFAIAFAAGTIVASRLQFAMEVSFLWVTIGGGISLLWRKHTPVAVAGLSIIALGLAGLRFQPLLPALDDSSRLLSQLTVGATIQGAIAEVTGDHGSTLVINTNSVSWSGATSREKIAGDILVQTHSYSSYEVNDFVEISGKVQGIDAIDSNDFRAYLERHNILFIMQYPNITLIRRDSSRMSLSILADLRTYFAGILSKNLPEPQSSVAQGLLLGQRQTLPPEVNNALERTGTSHILAISGFNITLLVSLTAFIGGMFLGKRNGLFLTTGVILAFMGLVGPSPSVMRAVIMGVLVILARYLGRQANASNFLALAGLGMVLHDPRVLWDAGFQLSFAATLGLIYISPLLYAQILKPLSRISGVDSVVKRGIVQLVAESAATTLGATLLTIPIIAKYFEGIPLASPVVNVLITPIPTIVTLLSMATVVTGTFFPSLSFIFAWPTLVVTTLLLETIKAFSSLDALYLPTIPPDDAHVLFYYAMILLAVGFAGHDPNLPGRARTADSVYISIFQLFPALFKSRPPIPVLRKPFLVLFIGGMVVLPLAITSVTPSSHYHLSFLDVGQGNSTLFRTPGGQNVLVDGGPSTMAALEQLDNRIPFYRRTIDLLILTHPHEDHLTGLIEIADRYRVGLIIEGNAEEDTTIYRKWNEVIANRKIPRIRISENMVVSLGPSGNLTIMPTGSSSDNPGDSNAQTLIVKIRTKDMTALLPSDADIAAQTVLVASQADLKSSIFLLPHHGSKAAFNEQFLAAVDPVLAIISVGKNNRYGHPSEPTLQKLSELNVKTLRTDELGWIDVEGEDGAIRIKTEKQLDQTPIR